MSNNRELSQFANFINIDDTSKNISFASSVTSLDVLGISTFNSNLDVEGNITASSFTGSGIGLTGTIDAADGTYGSDSATAQITVSNGRITSVTTSTMTAGLGGGGGPQIVFKDNGTSVGVAGTIDFTSNLSVTPASAGIVTVSFSGTIDNSQLSGSIANNKLANSSISLGGVTLNLGQSDATPAFDLRDATNLPVSALTGTINNGQMSDSSVSYGGVEVSLGGSDGTPAFDLTDATNYRASSLVGTLANNQLANNSVNFGGVSVTLGASDATPAFDLSDATNYRASSLVGTISNAQLAGSIANNKLANSSISGVSLGSNLNTLTRGTYLTGNNYNGSASQTWAVDATSTNTANKVVVRDGSGNFSAGQITATSFSGSGASLTDIPVSALTGTITTGQMSDSSVSYGGVEVSLGGSDATPAFDLTDATNYPASALTGTITNAQLAGSIANSKLSNSSVSFGGVSVNLGASDATPAFDLSDATNYPTSSLSGTITNAQLAGSIANSKLSNSSVSFGGVSVNLGGSDGTPAFDLSDATGYRASALTGSIANSQLEGSSSLIITSDTTFYVATNGNDSTGSGSSGSPWATPNKAAEYLSQRRIKAGVIVTVSIGAGTYTFSSEQRLEHPQSSQIKYVGATPAGNKPFGNALKGTANPTPIRGNTSSSNTYNNNLLISYYTTRFQFNNCIGFLVGGGNNVNLQNILLRGNNGTLGDGSVARGIVVQSGRAGGLGGTISLINCAIHNFSGAGIALVFGGNAKFDDLTITNCGGGVSNNSGVVFGDASSLGLSVPLTVSNCNGGGYSGTKNSSSRIDRCMLSNNGSGGLDVREGALVRALGCTISNNGKEGIRAELAGVVVVRNSTVSNNGKTGVRASGSSFIDFRDGTLTGNGSPSSPMLNTTGSSNAFITN